MSPQEAALSTIADASPLFKERVGWLCGLTAAQRCKLRRCSQSRSGRAPSATALWCRELPGQARTGCLPRRRLESLEAPVQRCSGLLLRPGRPGGLLRAGRCRGRAGRTGQARARAKAGPSAGQAQLPRSPQSTRLGHPDGRAWPDWLPARLRASRGSSDASASPGVRSLTCQRRATFKSP